MCRREFAGVETAKVIQMPRRVWTRRWAIAAVAALLTVGVGLSAPSVLNVVLTPAGPRATVASVDGALIAISAEGQRVLAAGAPIEEGQQIRTGKESRAVVRLRDGSTVEMRERSELNIEEKWRSKTIHLERGSVIVEAAKQRDGRLEVADRRCACDRPRHHLRRQRRTARLARERCRRRRSGRRNRSWTSHPPPRRSEDHKFHGTHRRDRRRLRSQNAAQYIALLKDLREVSQQISSIPMPGLRYSSRLIDRVPEMPWSSPPCPTSPT